MSECEAGVVPRGKPGYFTRIRCGEYATVTVEYGCVHEHVSREDVCPEHARKLTEDGILACTACWKAGHECHLVGRVVVAP